MLKINNLKKSFKETVIFNNLNLEINECGIHVISGKSGCGKSTLINMIMGYEKIDDGEIIVDTKPVMIFQNYELFDNLSVKDNILLGKDDNQLNYYLIDKLDMRECLNNKVSELSSGQRQRVGILRTLLNDNCIILCDEPTESLDISNKYVVMNLLKEISKNSIIILVTHDIELAKEYGDYFYLLENNDLKLIKESNGKKCKSRINDNFTKDNTENIYKKLFIKKDLIFCLVHSISLVILSLILIFSIKWFNIPNTTNTLSSNHLYLELENISLDDVLNYLNLKNRDYRISYKFNSLYLDDRYHYIDIYPHPYEDEGLYINQNAKEIFSNSNIGDDVLLNYYADNKEMLYTTKIKEYIVEEDTKLPIIYYGYKEFTNYLQSLKTDDGNELENMLNKKEFVDVPINYEELETIFSKIDFPSIKVRSPLYQERIQFIEDSTIYKFVYNIFEIIVLFIIFVMNLIYINKSTNENIDAFAILISQGHELNILKRIFLRNKIIFNILSILITLLVIVFVSYMININISDLKLYTLILIIYLFISIIISLILFNSIHKNKMNEILKNRFD